ncbi:MAG: hypothetical protein JWQ40_2160, partial [Segetibacter sp.]|nr:hypothetical protein [Segetibacter sp.]
MCPFPRKSTILHEPQYASAHEVGERFAINKLIAKQFAMKKKSKQSYSIPLRLHRVAGIDC